MIDNCVSLLIALRLGVWNKFSMILYVDSVQKASKHSETAATQTSYHFTANALSDDRDFDSALDEVRLYNYALSQADINAIFAE